MSTYVVSDIHGCYTEYLKMLKKIKFDPKKDGLIIAGDIIDRGPENLEMLRYMESEPESVIFLMGNHDYDFIGYCRGVEIMCDRGMVFTMYTSLKTTDIVITTFTVSYLSRVIIWTNYMKG